MSGPLRFCLVLLLAACNGPDDTDPADTDGGDTDEPAVPSFCEENGWTENAFDAAGPYGVHRHELADDFTVVHHDGTEWDFEDEWTGCESYLFVPDFDSSIWAADVDELLERSPANAHYFFVTLKSGDTAAENLAAMQQHIDEVLAEMSGADEAWWRPRLHVVADGSGWLYDVFDGIGEEGWAIDREQRIRGIGSFSDVERYNGSSGWPYDPNLAYVAYEAHYFDAEAARAARMAAVAEPTIVPLWTGEVISQYADMTVELPSAAEMAAFDTFEIDVDMRCPDPESPEFNNCGAWDYLANFYVQDGEEWIELGRMITTYHREARWVVDVTPMMAHLLDGGTRTFRWSWAPEWNVQPTETRLSLRFSNQGKGYAPRKATLVATGGGFSSTYNDGRVPAEVPVSASATHVELWALITGHGMETNNCAEFCNHQHEFTVGSSTYLQEYPIASDDTGCRDQGIPNQMTPNQWGTWWYGRGGWCPGQPVVPFAVDVTADVSAGSTATVGYRGLYREDDTPPDGSGNILMNAWLVEYE
jgi:hypothetical protein